MRAHAPPRPHHLAAHTPPWPAFPRHYTDLARIFLLFREYLKAVPTPSLHLLGV